MTTQWFLAKYVADLDRHEPDNIGLLLQHNGIVVSRFLGQRADNTIDGRSIKPVQSVPTYRAWVHHWSGLVESSGFDGLADAARRSARDDNYFLEFGGEVLLGADASQDPHDVMDELFTRLVDDTQDRSTESIAHTAERIMVGVEARIGKPIQRENTVIVKKAEVVDELRFDYRFNNGRPHLMQRVGLTYPDNRSWDRLHAAAWSFQQVHQADDAGLRNADLIALVKSRPEDKTLDRQLKQLESHAYVVDLRDAKAEEQLAELIAD